MTTPCERLFYDICLLAVTKCDSYCIGVKVASFTFGDVSLDVEMHIANVAYVLTRTKYATDLWEVGLERHTTATTVLKTALKDVV